MGHHLVFASGISAESECQLASQPIESPRPSWGDTAKRETSKSDVAGVAGDDSGEMRIRKRLQKTMENHHCSWENSRTFYGHFSKAMLSYRRVIFNGLWATGIYLVVL